MLLYSVIKCRLPLRGEARQRGCAKKEEAGRTRGLRGHCSWPLPSGTRCTRADSAINGQKTSPPGHVPPGPVPARASWSWASCESSSSAFRATSGPLALAAAPSGPRATPRTFQSWSWASCESSSSAFRATSGPPTSATKPSGPRAAWRTFQSWSWASCESSSSRAARDPADLPVLVLGQLREQLQRLPGHLGAANLGDGGERAARGPADLPVALLLGQIHERLDGRPERLGAAKECPGQGGELLAHDLLMNASACRKEGLFERFRQRLDAAAGLGEGDELFELAA
ncbi:unnamed protein product [Prorocentrum cordatum]|uniref:Uncharacterized protein n=1 Tax=Prorocentrum cordatum TaxID=2364126 RepID=A0ABN9PGH9_9DINO|nr:unnamed protein product [Polarella glacialis]